MIIGVPLMGMVLTAMAALGTAPEPPFEVAKPDYPTYHFEADAVPPEFTAAGDSELSVSRDFYKEGSRSLRWEWRSPDAALHFKNAEAFRHLTGRNADPIVYEWVTFCTLSSFSSWIFSEKPLGKPLWMELGGSRFYVNMNFSGWGNVALLYGRDLAKFPAAGSDTLTIRPPEGVTQGVLYFDLFAPRRETDVRMVRSTSRQPYVLNKKLDSETVNYQEATASEEAFAVMVFDAKATRWAPGKTPELTAENRTLLQQLRERFFQPYQEKPRFRAAEFDKLAAIRAQHRLVRNGAFVNGEIGRVPKFYENWLTIARALKSGVLNPEQERSARELALDMADLVIQQGHSNFYVQLPRYFAPFLLLREDLIAAGKYDAFLARMRNIAGVPEFYLLKPWGNADFYNNLLWTGLGTILLQRDAAAAWMDLTALQRWLEATAAYGELAPDGTFMHHRMIYTGYGFPAIGPLVETLYFLRKTPFFAPKMYELARKGLLTMTFYGNPYTPNMFAGRHRKCDPVSWAMAEKLRLLAEMGDTLDRECAERYLYYAGLYGKKVQGWDGVIAVNPQGSRALNYAVSLLHRHGDAVAVVRGQRDRLFTNEAYAFQGANTMGRYLNYGQLQVLAGMPEASGFVMDRGWDFNFWPGTTTRVLPLEALRQHFENVEMLTRESFGGATALDGSGVWAMKLQEELPEVGDPLRIGPPRYWLGDAEYLRRCRESRYDTTFRARKSMFFFGDVIAALGSGIVSDDASTPVVTTLAQNSTTATRAGGAPSGDGWLIDAVGNGFYFGDAAPVIRRGEVAKPYFRNWFPKDAARHNETVSNAGYMELIYLDHGKAPRDGSYFYCQLIRPEAGAMRDFAAAMRRDGKEAPLTVLRQDAAAHIVREKATAMTGYALFDAGKTGHGPLRAASAPVLAMVREDGNSLRVSVFNPQFDDTADDMPYQRGAMTVVEFDPAWQLMVENPRVRSLGNGRFEVTNRDLEPTEWTLVHRDSAR